MKQQLNWATYDPNYFKINCLWSGDIKIPDKLLESGLVGYFFVSADDSIIHLFDLKNNAYSFNENFETDFGSSFLNPKNNCFYKKRDPILEPFLINDQIFYTSNNFFYLDGWYRQILKQL